VGENAARILHDKGYRIVAVSDSKGGIVNQRGLDINGIIQHKRNSGTLESFAGAERISNDELLTCDCDILIPAALSDQLNRENAKDVKAQIILELANAPTTPEADEIFFERSIMLIPDVLANAGGVVGSYFEWIQNLSNDHWKKEKILARLNHVMITAFDELYSTQQKDKGTMRKSAYKIAVKRILKAESLRGNV
jgi:glutamate dehydrogenase/leucine dehydrogenase